jgi:hypothetical protein
MALTKREIFGPVLPVVPYDTLDQAIFFINSNRRSLALYCFSHDGGEHPELLRRTHSGGVTFNDWRFKDAFADYVLCHPGTLIPIPDNLSFSEAAALPVGLATEHDFSSHSKASRMEAAC